MAQSELESEQIHLFQWYSELRDVVVQLAREDFCSPP
jgi:hypothetical protein